MVSVDSSLRRLKLSSGKSGAGFPYAFLGSTQAQRTEPVSGQLRACPTISKFVPFAPLAGQCVNDSDASKSPASRRYQSIRNIRIRGRMNTEAVREQMIEQQVRAGDVLDMRILDAMRRVRREMFAPEAYRQVAYAEAAIPLPCGQTMLPPVIHGRILQALSPSPSEVVLVVGAGTGYLAACLSQLAARVRALEIFPELADQARANLLAAAANNVGVETADGMQLDEQGIYSAIAVTGSLPQYDERFQRALRVGGRLLVVVGQPPVMEAWKVTRVGEREWQRESLFETVIDPLINAPRPPAFIF